MDSFLIFSIFFLENTFFLLFFFKQKPQKKHFSKYKKRTKFRGKFCSPTFSPLGSTFLFAGHLYFKWKIDTAIIQLHALSAFEDDRLLLLAHESNVTKP